jgi:hypothetical protein
MTREFPPCTTDFGHNRFTFGPLPRFKQLFHTRGKPCVMSPPAERHTTRVEGAECQLCTRLTNGLGGHNTNGHTQAQPACTQSPSRCHNIWRQIPQTPAHRSSASGRRLRLIPSKSTCFSGNSSV